VEGEKRQHQIEEIQLKQERKSTPDWTHSSSPDCDLNARRQETEAKHAAQLRVRGQEEGAKLGIASKAGLHDGLF
jgi:hypothetical protein